MTPNYITIITPIVPALVDELIRYLRDHAEPRAGSGAELVQCRPLFRFDRINSLHFCSFVVLSGNKEFAPSLVFEATFDGPRAPFLQDLWHVAPEGMHAVYKNCIGYPESGLDVPKLVEDYLIHHDVGAQTFFSGCPGRSVAQIQAESQLRGDLVTFLSSRLGKPGNNPSLAGFQQAIQRDFVRSRAENRWAEQPAMLPWEVARRGWVVLIAIVAVLAGTCLLGGIVLRAMFGRGPAALRDCIEQVFEATWRFGRKLTEDGSSGWDWLGRLISELQLPILPLVLVLAALWIVVRVAELFLSTKTGNPRDQSFIWRFPLHVIVILRYALPIFLVGFVVLGIVGKDPSASVERSATPSQVKLFIDKVDRTLAPVDNAVREQSPSRFASFLMLLVAFFVWVGLHYWATSLKLAVQFQMLSSMDESWRLFLLDGLRFAMVVTAVLAVLVIARHVPLGALVAVAHFVRAATLGILMIAAYTAVGIFAGYALAFVLLLIVRALERADLQRFKRAADLVGRPLANTHACVREEGGINRYQNHLASLTYVKPGFLRRWFLRATLFFVNLLSRFWFNRGELGGIPTILSARWVLIDRGRRLLFLDNYGGAWNSYLNEFIDMGAVKGLNAIWSNTYVQTADATKYAYPDSRYYFWRGAQAEQPFKAYVRQSQLETIVWYSAYPRLGITNINMNTGLRQSLFKQLSPSELDSIMHRL